MKKQGAAPPWLVRAQECLRARFTERLGLAELARQVAVHPAHLAREYRRHFGCTVGEQVRRLRIARACHEMQQNRRSLAEIAHESGFADQSHFTRSFRREMGTSPRQWLAAPR